MQELSKIYWELQLEEPVDLAEFCQRVKVGAYGPFSTKEIEGFLREVEAAMLENIETMLEEHPQLASVKEERIEETVEMIKDLIERYGPG